MVTDSTQDIVAWRGLRNARLRATSDREAQGAVSA